VCWAGPVCCLYLAWCVGPGQFPAYTWPGVLGWDSLLPIPGLVCWVGTVCCLYLAWCVGPGQFAAYTWPGVLGWDSLLPVPGLVCWAGPVCCLYLAWCVGLSQAVAADSESLRHGVRADDVLAGRVVDTTEPSLVPTKQ
jgi:hypothetical protein